jgi:hypothetical protein
MGARSQGVHHMGGSDDAFADPLACTAGIYSGCLAEGLPRSPFVDRPTAAVTPQAPSLAS